MVEDSMCSAKNNNVFPENTNASFTNGQLRWLTNESIPERIYLKMATEFDDNYVDVKSNRWEFRFSGRNIIIDYGHGENFKSNSASINKLIKLITICYMSEYSGAKAADIANHMAKSMREIKSFSHDSFIFELKKLSLDVKFEVRFYSVLYALRKLDIKGFFQETDGDSDLEEKLLFVSRPATNRWGIYNEIDNILPFEVACMIENGLHLWADKLTPKLKTEEEKQKHLKRVKEHFDIGALHDCIILGLIYAIGMRPVQISKISVGDICIDTELNDLTRFSVSVPYAKKIKIHVDRVRVAIPEETGKLVYLYQTLLNLHEGDPLIPQDKNADQIVNAAIARQLLRFSSKEMQDAVKAKEAEAPVYTASIFRHHVGHSMAMSGASAEEIAYILGQSNTVVANRYISATPNLADIREKALGANPVFKNMIALMMTGNLIHSKCWGGRKVAGCVGGKLHFHIGGCNYEEPICPFSQIRACYGCLYFKPFLDGDHHKVFDSFNEEIINLIKLSNDTGEMHHPLISELTRRKNHVNTVICRISIFNKAGEVSDA